MKQTFWNVLSALLIASITVITLSFSAAVGLIIYESFFKIPEQVTVPSTTGKRVQDVVVYLKRFGLNPIIKEEFKDGVQPGIVISQEPRAGERVKGGRDIKLTASLGTELVSIPDVRGMSLAEGQVLLGQKRFPLGKVTFSETETKAEEITEQNPKENSRVVRGTKVNLKVNKGPVIKHEVPVWEGKKYSEAVASSKDTPFSLGRVRWLYHEYIPKDTIIRQTPPPKTFAPKNRPVNIDVSAGNRMSELFIKQETITFIVPDGDSRKEVKALLKDSRGNIVLYRADHMPGDRVELFVTTYGGGEVTIFSDNKLRSKIYI